MTFSYGNFNYDNGIFYYIDTRKYDVLELINIFQKENFGYLDILTEHTTYSYLRFPLIIIYFSVKSLGCNMTTQFWPKNQELTLNQVKDIFSGKNIKFSLKVYKPKWKDVEW